MKLRNAVLSAGVSAAALLAAQGVMAGSLKDDGYEPMPAPVTSWQGFYLGAHIGAGEADLQGVYDDNDSQVDFDRIDLSGVLGGAHAGYNWDFGHWIIGVEADISAMDWSGVAQAPDSTEEAEGEFDTLASIRGRVGVPVGSDRSGLLYATGGFAFPDGSLLVCESGCFADDPDEFANLDFDDVGGVVGGGFEWAATDKIRVRFETLYYMFDEDEDFDVDGGADGTAGLDDAWTARVGATWYLNGNY